MIDFADSQSKQMTRLQFFMDSKQSGNSLTYSSYSGLRGSFFYEDGSSVLIFPVVDAQGNVIAITWNGKLRGPIRGQFLHNGVPLGTQISNTKINGDWVAFLLNYIPSQCLSNNPYNEIPSSDQNAQVPSLLPTTPTVPPTPIINPLVPTPTTPTTPTSPVPLTPDQIPQTGISTSTVPSTELDPNLPDTDYPVNYEKVIICLQGFWIAKTGINYLPGDRVLLSGLEDEFNRRKTEIVPLLDGDGRIVSISITGDTCNIPYIPVPYIPSPTGNNAKLIPIPKLIPFDALPIQPANEYINADNSIISPPIKTVYCFTH